MVGWGFAPVVAPRGCGGGATAPTGKRGRDVDASFYTYRELHDRPEFFNGPNFSNRNAQLVLRSLGYDREPADESGVCGPFEPRELKGRLLVALAVGGALPDHGTPAVESGGLIECGLPAGYFRRAYERILPVCEQAERWGSWVLVG